LILLLVAQLAVAPVPDIASYATAAINPTIAAVQAWKSAHRACRFGQLAIAEAVGNGAALTLKHFVVSPRPCAGCLSDGMPSGHTMNAAIGVSQGWRYGLALTVATGALRVDAHRHTPRQVLAGAGLGIGADFASRNLLRCRE